MRLPQSSRNKLRRTVISWPTLIPQRLPPNGRLYLIGCLCSIAGLLYGLDTGSVGPIIVMPQFQQVAGDMSSSLQGFFVASILLSASASSLSSGWVADKISRRLGIAVGALIFLCGALVSITSRHLATFFVARLITGIGAGQTISVASVYLVEVASAQVRGQLACLLQFFITVGVAAGYFICYGSQALPSNLSWQIPFIVQAFLSAGLAFAALLVVPFSPRWLASKGHTREALAVLRQLRMSRSHSLSGANHHEDVAIQQELTSIEAALAAAHESAAGRSASFAELFTGRHRRRTWLGIFLMVCQQLSGIDVVLYYAPVVFSALFTSQTASFLASGVSGIVLMVSTIPAILFVDRWGRRAPMICGGVAMSICFFVTGGLFAAAGRVSKGEEGTEGVNLTLEGPAKWIVVMLIYAFLCAFSVTWAPIVRIYAAEIVPTRLRSRAAATQQLSNWTANFAVALIAPLFLRASPSGPYFLFASCTAIATIVCVLFVRETKGKSLEDIADMFEGRSE